MLPFSDEQKDKAMLTLLGIFGYEYGHLACECEDENTEQNWIQTHFGVDEKYMARTERRYSDCIKCGKPRVFVYPMCAICGESHTPRATHVRVQNTV